MTDLDGVQIRLAHKGEVSTLAELQATALRQLSASYYDDDQIEECLRSVGTFDPSLIDDGTFYVATLDDEIVGCGGWSPNGQLYGNREDWPGHRNGQPRTAAIRSIFVRPCFTRRGIARVMTLNAEMRARGGGYYVFELLSTLNALPFYAGLGYRAVEAANIYLPNELVIPAIKMRKLNRLH